MYKKPVEILAKEIRYEPLAPDVRAVIVQSWRNFGLLPAAPSRRWCLKKRYDDIKILPLVCMAVLDNSVQFAFAGVRL